MLGCCDLQRVREVAMQFKIDSLCGEVSVWLLDQRTDHLKFTIDALNVSMGQVGRLTEHNGHEALL
jgi:hypothetical protein